jgi:site-specific recombinase XerD
MHWHDRRHTTALRLWREGWDLYEIQLMLGHTSPLTTQRYLQVSQEELRERARAHEATRRTGRTRRSRFRVVGNDV